MVFAYVPLDHHHIYQKQEYQALKELKEDKSRVILTVDKGVSLVIMDRAEYNKKAEVAEYRDQQKDPR